MANRQLEVEAAKEPVMFHVLDEEVGDGAPDRPWRSDYEEVE